ncbi:MAG: peptidoglycan DD-metalloendopeptidase family protein [Deltaproteobacteria bacterium]|nr:peptidoglycan DD-metalloendopeptidase family protein [Deltaproteobacteria bacterium]
MAGRLIILSVLFLIAACGHSGTGIYHTVRKGETLYRLGRTYGVDSRHIARANGIYRPQDLKAGQNVFIPGADRVRDTNIDSSSEIKTVVPKPSPAARKAETKRPRPKPVVQSRKSQPRPATVPAPAPPLPPLRFSWPVKGKIVKTFNPTGNHPSRGVEIAVPAGAPVFSAGPGKVIYSGNGIKGFGNLLILEHQDSFFTIYGYNQKNLVPSGAFVGQGEKIALAGRPPSGGAARLHFQIRQGKEVLDPLRFLPR